MSHPFFHFGLKFFKGQGIQNKKIILAISGGLDSSVLLDWLKELSAPCKLRLSVAYVHHGSSAKKAVEDYREKRALLSQI